MRLAVGSKVEGPQILAAPLLEDRYTGSSSGIAEERPVVLFCTHRGEYCQQ